MKRAITPMQRRHQDYLRRKGLKVGAVYMNRLMRLRTRELKRVLEICRSYDDTGTWADIIERNLDESGYFKDWLTGLYLEAGLPHAQSITRDMSRGKASQPAGAWAEELQRYATQRAGEEIVIVSGTEKETIRGVLTNIMTTEPELGIEKLTKRILKDYTTLERWQIRRIAQTESMIGMAEAGRIAADTLEIPFTKQWSCSGLANSRETHLMMDGAIVDQDEWFELPDCRMQYPHDNSMRPPAGEIINCACDCIRRPK